jgi:hypothetical protein
MLAPPMVGLLRKQARPRMWEPAVLTNSSINLWPAS